MEGVRLRDDREDAGPVPPHPPQSLPKRFPRAWYADVEADAEVRDVDAEF